jgi:aryl-alcohol dehydrogenase-like predicted oxidoreductase
LIDKAWELGIRSFDVSNNYGYGEAETLIGQCLKKYPRQEYVICTKGSWPIGETPYHKGLSKKHIYWAFDESMKRLGLDYVDVYYAHRYDPEVPMEEIVRAYNHLIDSGRVLYWATSEWPLAALEECLTVCNRLGLEKPICEQFIYSYALQKSVTNGVKGFCEGNGMGTLGFSPLCQGYFTGKYRNGVPDGSRISKSEQLNYNKTANFYQQNKTRIDYFLETCDKFNADYVAAALQWCLRMKIYPVFGASKVEQLEKNVKALSAELPEELWIELEKCK